MNFDTIASALKDRARLITFISSNDSDFLTGQLKSQLYSRSNILTRKLLVTPNEETLKGIERELLHDEELGINFGYRPQSLSGCIETLLLTLMPLVRLPKPGALRQAIMEYASCEEGQGGFFQELMRGKTTDLSFFTLLAQLFEDYGLHGVDEERMKACAWQRELFDRLKKTFYFPLEFYRAATLDNCYLMAGFEVHIYGLTVIAPAYLNFFLAIASVVPVYFYVPAVSQEFSWDMVSDYAEAAFGLTVNNKNSLLANFQKSLIPLIKFLTDHSSFQNERFLTFDNQSNLYHGGIKQSLVTASGSDAGKVAVEMDDALTIIEAMNPYSEVEKVVDQVENWIDRGVRTEEIVVMALDINRYGPLLAWAMGSRNICCRVQAPLSFSSLQDECVACIISCLEGRLSKDQVLELIALELVKKRISTDPAILAQCRQVIEESSVTFGFDAAHREQIMQYRSGDQHLGTWTHFFDQINIYAIFSHQGLKASTKGGHRLIPEWGLCEAMASLHKILEEVYHFQRRLEENKESLDDWLSAVLTWLESVFGINPVKSVKLLFQQELTVSSGVKFSGALFLKMWKEKWQSRRMLESDGKGILCAEWHEGNFLGKKVVFLLGADSENLPRSQEPSPLDLKKSDQLPSYSALQKGRFLLMLGLNHTALTLSYSKIGFDRREQSRSLLIDKLERYTQEMFSSSDLPPFSRMTQPPAYPFLPENFLTPHCRGQGFKLYQAAHQPYQPPMPLILDEDQNTPLVISWQQLHAMIKDPLVSFVKTGWDLNLPYPRESQEFSLKPFQEKKLVEQALKNGSAIFFKQQLNQGALPHHSFTGPTYHRLQSALLGVKKHLGQIDLNVGEKRSFIIDSQATRIAKNGQGGVRFPPVNLRLDCGKHVQIVGAFQEISHGVCWHFVEEKIEEVLPFWPQIVLYSYCSKLLGEAGNICRFKTGEKRFLPDGDCEKFFSNMVEYYLQGMAHLSFIPGSGSASGDSIKEKKRFLEKQGYSPYYQLFEMEECHQEYLQSSYQTIEQDCLQWLQSRSSSV